MFPFFIAEEYEIDKKDQVNVGENNKKKLMWCVNDLRRWVWSCYGICMRDGKKGKMGLQRSPDISWFESLSFCLRFLWTSSLLISNKYFIRICRIKAIEGKGGSSIDQNWALLSILFSTNFCQSRDHRWSTFD